MNNLITRLTAMRIIFFLLLLCTCNVHAQVQTLKPSHIHPFPDIDFVELERIITAIDEDPDFYDKMSAKEKDVLNSVNNYGDSEVIHHWSDGCSWYCGGWVDNLTASSSLSENYCAKNAHDTSVITAWVEGKQGNGEGEYLSYSFAGGCPRVTKVFILNGYTKNEIVWNYLATFV